MPAERIIPIISRGGLGDILLSTPIYRALKKKHGFCKIIVFCSRKDHIQVYKGNPHIDELRDISFWRNPVFFIQYYMKWRRFYGFFYAELAPSVSTTKKAAVIMGEMVDVVIDDTKMDICLTREEEEAGRRGMAGYQNPIIIHPASLTSKNQEWPVGNWEELIRQMPEYTFIQLGHTENDKLTGAVDLRGKTSIREAMALVKYARSFAGVNSFFSHVASAFDIPGVVLFGPSNPEIWGHPGHINIYKRLRCAPCIDLVLQYPCPYGKPCMTGITVREVRDALLSQLAKSAHGAFHIRISTSEKLEVSN